MIKSIIIRIAIVILGIFVVVLGRWLFFYNGSYIAPSAGIPSYEHVVAPEAPSTEFSETPEKGEGTILIDLSHNNTFDREELNVLMSRLISRGLTIKFLNTEDNLETELLGGKDGQDKKLLGADAFIVVCPQKEFSNKEIETIGKFVANGSKLFLIADPTRSSQINSLSIKFGLVFEPDYLYNMKENEINYRNIFVTEFKENVITKNLKRIALYTAGSISSADCGIAFVDENTFSSLIESRKGLSPIALAQESKVLAVYDLTFITEPNNGILDNNQLISNIANWLSSH